MSSRLAEAVELLMKQEGYVPDQSPLPEGVRALPDAAKFAALPSEFKKLEYLEYAGFLDGDICAHLRCNRRQLEKLRREEDEARERRMTEMVGPGALLTEALVLANIPGSTERPLVWQALLSKLQTVGRINGNIFEEIKGRFVDDGLVYFVTDGEERGIRRTREGDAAASTKAPFPLEQQEVEL